MNASLRWGIDLGGTKIEGVVISPDSPTQPLARLRVPTEQQQGYRHILDQIEKLVQLLIEEVGSTPDRIGIGTPGALDPDSQTLKNSNTLCLIGKPLKADLEAQLGVPCILANDANCFALAEAKLGVVPAQVPHADVVFGVIMGTGVGGGVVVGDRVLHGRHGIAGEWGHNFLDESGGPCYCGRVGCVETILSGPSLERFYRTRSGQNRRLPEIIQRARAGNDPIAILTLDRLVTMFGKALGPIINILDPDAIVIGGGVGNISELYDLGRDHLARHVFNPHMATKILKPQLGDSAGVFGAAMLVANS
ncbi:ROK family protein [Pontibacter sp. G13]|uniref:ROK family protein n=1 Tax=Pontibacter sp. G13 TaxID=3074898 RepID=UPI00288AD9DC|nr:ROK family protein [Pontibacter sp. G13]WNJ19779.1 ROK family protein [Pontibacter sp. G13]